MNLILWAAWVLGLWVVIAATYRGFFSVAAVLARHRFPRSDESTDGLPIFAVVIPAHDEELLIAAAIGSIRSTAYPQDRVQIHVVADNCSDGTARIAREADAAVWERHDRENPGKGQALQWFFAKNELRDAEAIVIIDADNFVNEEFFDAMAAALARGGRCLQAYGDIANPSESSLTRLMALTHIMKNELYLAGKAATGASVTLMGTGMVFARDVIDRYGWGSTSIGEDLEHTFELLEEGERIDFVQEARIYAQDSTTLRQGYSQRQRWATGRSALARRARSFLWLGIRRRRLMWVDAALDLLMPSYSKLLYLTVLAIGISALVVSHDRVPLWIAAAAMAQQLADVGFAVSRSRLGAADLGAMSFAPIFLIWKAGIDLLATLGHRNAKWTRTRRKPHRSDHE